MNNLTHCFSPLHFFPTITFFLLFSLHIHFIEHACHSFEINSVFCYKKSVSKGYKSIITTKGSFRQLSFFPEYSLEMGTVQVFLLYSKKAEEWLSLSYLTISRPTVSVFIWKVTLWWTTPETPFLIIFFVFLCYSHFRSVVSKMWH